MLVLALLGSQQDPGLTGPGPESWDLAGILGTGQELGPAGTVGTWQESWTDRDLSQGGAGKGAGTFIFNVLIVAKNSQRL